MKAEERDKVDIYKVNSNGIIAYGVRMGRKIYKIVKLDDGFAVYHKDAPGNYRNRIKANPNKGWAFNLCLICTYYDAAENYVINDMAT